MLWVCQGWIPRWYTHSVQCVPSLKGPSRSHIPRPTLYEDREQVTGAGVRTGPLGVDSCLATIHTPPTLQCTTQSPPPSSHRERYPGISDVSTESCPVCYEITCLAYLPCTHWCLGRAHLITCWVQSGTTELMSAKWLKASSQHLLSVSSGRGSSGDSTKVNWAGSLSSECLWSSWDNIACTHTCSHTHKQTAQGNLAPKEYYRVLEGSVCTYKHTHTHTHTHTQTETAQANLGPKEYYREGYGRLPPHTHTHQKLPKVWITINCGKFFKRWEYQTTWSASWEICMQVTKQQLEQDMEQQTGSKW